MNSNILNQATNWILQHKVRGFSVLPEYCQATKQLEYRAQFWCEDGDVFVASHQSRERAVEIALTKAKDHLAMVN